MRCECGAPSTRVPRDSRSQNPSFPSLFGSCHANYMGRTSFKDKMTPVSYLRLGAVSLPTQEERLRASAKIACSVERCARVEPLVRVVSEPAHCTGRLRVVPNFGDGDCQRGSRFRARSLVRVPRLSPDRKERLLVV